MNLHKALIANEIFGDGGSGGGGSSDFSTAEVTIVNNCAEGSSILYCCIAMESPIHIIPAQSTTEISVDASATQTINAILYKGKAEAYVESSSSIAVSASGNAEFDEYNTGHITGDCTITITDA